MGEDLLKALTGSIPLTIRSEQFWEAVPYCTVEKVVYNDPATVVYWGDGSKTVVKCHDGDVYDERTGFLLCCAKKLFGNTGRYNDVMRANAPETTRQHDLVTAFRNLFAGLGL